ncbi:XRE family transcriptional regulator [Nitrospira sp. KM1]|uniref:XRE family transcriptional regulator n=1 Tax=Nitrospira sp. KM1 TaxID=1936990 RepID=UPI001E55850B|nr:XRE family transcriptional regulator [Nitrospira sp. KM1]
MASESHLESRVLEDIETGTIDPPASLLESIAASLKIPVAWMFSHPTAFQQLFHESDDEDGDKPEEPDPVTARILSASRMDHSLYVLLTVLMQHADPKLLRAAEASLRSLVKQSKQSSIPWQNRPSGHFEPPSD